MTRLPFKPEKICRNPAFPDSEPVSLCFDLLILNCLESGISHFTYIDKDRILFNPEIPEKQEFNTLYSSIHRQVMAYRADFPAKYSGAAFY